jgi:hypothetical protein
LHSRRLHDCQEFLHDVRIVVKFPFAGEVVVGVYQPLMKSLGLVETDDR